MALNIDAHSKIVELLLEREKRHEAINTVKFDDPSIISPPGLVWLFLFFFYLYILLFVSVIKHCQLRGSLEKLSHAHKSHQ